MPTFRSIVVAAVCLVGCAPALDTKPSEYWIDGETECDPAGAPEAASLQGHVANWWSCLKGTSAFVELRLWNTFSGELMAKVPLGATSPLWLPAYGSDGWLTVVHDATLDEYSPDGHLWWRVALPASPSTNPSLTKDDDIVVGDRAGQLHAFSKAGNPLWSVSLGGAAINRIAIARDGTLVAAVKNSAARYDLVSLAWGGAERWRVAADVAVASPIITKRDHVVLTTYLGDAADMPADPAKFRLRAYAVDTGAVVWDVALSGDAYGAVEGPDGSLYVASVSGGGVQAFNDSDGSARWKVAVPGETAAPTVLSTGQLALGCDKGMCLLSTATGAAVGDMPAGKSGVGHGPFAQNGILSAPTVSGHYYLWEMGSDVNTAPGCWSRLGGDDRFSGRAP